MSLYTRLSDFPYFPDNPNFNIMAVRAHSMNNSGCTDVGEVFRALNGMKKSGDPEEWHERWRNMADSVHVLAERAEKENHPVTARKSYLRSSTYYRFASLFIKKDYRSLDMYEKHVSDFSKFASLSEPVIERIQIPYEGIHMSGWYMPPKKKMRDKNPAYIYSTGQGGGCEVAFQTSPTEAVERGIGVLFFDAPGCGSTRIYHKVYGFPEFEKPFKAAMDYLIGRPDIDPNNIGVAGSDFGAYNAVRAAVFDKRVKCCGLITACYDALVDLYDYGQEEHRDAFAAFFGETDEIKIREKLKPFNLDGIADKLTVPLVVFHAEETVNYPIEPAYRLFREATGPKELRVVNSDHNTGARRMEVLCGLADWFSDHLR
jgi:dipeptidyl aminopeptidase/acylaminoacyl peptidase